MKIRRLRVGLALSIWLSIATATLLTRAQTQPTGDQVGKSGKPPGGGQACEQTYKVAMEKIAEENTEATAQYQKSRVDCGSDRTCLANAQQAYHAAQRKIEKEQIDAGSRRSICLERARLSQNTPLMAPTAAPSSSIYPSASGMPTTAPTNRKRP